MSSLNAFLATWSQARETFGQSAPVAGAEFDDSARLRQLQGEVQAAAPGSIWQGAASEAYASANRDHAEIFGKAADLDARLAAQIDRSAAVVNTGRTRLDSIRDWVVAAASSVPDNTAGRTMLMHIMSHGYGQIGETIETSNAELNAIGAQIRQVGAEYQTLGEQRFARRDDVLGAMGDEEQPPPADEVAAWYVEWNALNREAAAHNTAVAAHERAKPPAGSNPALVAAWNARAAELRTEAQRIYDEQLALAAEAVTLGIPEPTVTPPHQTQAAAPAGLRSQRPSTEWVVPR